MAFDIDQILSGYPESGVSAALNRVFIKAMGQGVPADLSSIERVALFVEPHANPALIEQVKTIASEKRIQTALWMAQALDGSPELSLGPALHRELFAHMDDQPEQARDVVVRNLCLAFIVGQLFPGPADEAVEVFCSLETGKSLLCYFAAGDLGSRFPSALPAHRGALLDQLFEATGGDAVGALSGVMSEEMVGRTIDVVEELNEAIDSLVGEAATKVSRVRASLSAAADRQKSSDRWPIYGFLASRAIAEGCVVLAMAEDEAAAEPTESLPAPTANAALDVLDMGKPGPDEESLFGDDEDTMNEEPDEAEEALTEEANEDPVAGPFGLDRGETVEAEDKVPSPIGEALDRWAQLPHPVKMKILAVSGFVAFVVFVMVATAALVIITAPDPNVEPPIPAYTGPVDPVLPAPSPPR